MADGRLRAVRADQVPHMLVLRQAQVHARQACQVGGHLGDAACQQPRAGHQALPALGEHAHHQVAVFQRRRAHADGNVDSFAHHVHAAVGFLEVDLHARIRGHEGRQHVGDARIEQRHRAGHAHDAARLGVGQRDGLVGGVGLHQHRLAVAVVGLAGLGDGKSPRGALDQARAETLLKLRDAPAQLGFGHPQRAARGRKAAVVHHLHVVVEVVQVFHCKPPSSFLR